MGYFSNPTFTHHASRITHHAPVLHSSFPTSGAPLAKEVDEGGSPISLAIDYRRWAIFRTPLSRITHHVSRITHPSSIVLSRPPERLWRRRLTKEDHPSPWLLTIGDGLFFEPHFHASRITYHASRTCPP